MMHVKVAATPLAGVLSMAKLRRISASCAEGNGCSDLKSGGLAQAHLRWF